VGASLTDIHALPDDHVLKPLEDRMLAMCEDMHPSVRVLGGNFVAALRAFAKERPWLYGRREDSESGEYRTMPLSDHAPYIHGGMTLAEFAACIGITLPLTNTDDVSEQGDERTH
jgi:hypothetical protein